MSRIEDALIKLGLTLPPAAAPAANYVPVSLTGRLAFVSGQLPVGPQGLEYRGKLGSKFDIAQGSQAARLAMLNVFAQLKLALEDLNRLHRCLRIGGFVNATPEFDSHPKVVNGASDLVVALMGDAGRHARYAVGVASLPFDAAVEIEALFELT
jgi:enamine deaminase RidA (YjgF/YER057c/UK114 family)